jgi:predicted nucleic-acid-binding Zn-ribbon protein
MASDIQECNTACIKCGSKDLLLNELWTDALIQFEVIDGKFDRQDGVLEPGFPFRIEIKCKKCKYEWKPRNKQTISDLY